MKIEYNICVDKMRNYMRVISGSSRGKKLVSLAGENTRPTLDRVKQALFFA